METHFLSIRLFHRAEQRNLMSIQLHVIKRHHAAVIKHLHHLLCKQFPLIVRNHHSSFITHKCSHFFTLSQLFVSIVTGRISAIVDVRSAYL